MGQRDLGAGGHLADHQWFLLRDHGQRVGGRHAGDHAPEGIGIGVVVQRAQELVRRHDEFLGAFAGLHHEGDKTGAQRLQLRHDLGRVLGEQHPLALVLRFQGSDHRPPCRIAGGGLRGHDHVVDGEQTRDNGQRQGGGGPDEKVRKR